jgi:hypothetical protein
MSPESIIDTNKPNAGRIYDYILGGHHNFEVDRQAAEQVLKLLPFAQKAMRLQRWCLQDIAAELTQNRGCDVIIDFASGLPTNDHIHHVVPKGTTVIYSDRDPVVVEYAHEILKDVPDTYYFEADIRRPENLLTNSEVQNILKGRRDVALVSWGVSAFLTDENIAHIAKYLHEWSHEKSCWVFNAQALGPGAKKEDPAAAQVKAIYTQMGTPIYLRYLDEFLTLLSPWKPDEKGFISLLDWHGISEKEMSSQDLDAVGQAGGGYGAYLVK